MEKNKPKVIETVYGVLVNGLLSDKYQSLREARKAVKQLNINKDTEQVEIVKQTTSQTLIDTYKPEVARVLRATDLGWD